MVRSGVGLGLGTRKEQGKSSAVVTQLVEGGAAFAQGTIENGDVLLKVDGFPVTSAAEAKRHLVGDEGTHVLLSFRKVSTVRASSEEREYQSNRVEEFNVLLIRKPLPQSLQPPPPPSDPFRGQEYVPPTQTAAEIARAAFEEQENLGPRRRHAPPPPPELRGAMGPELPRGALPPPPRGRGDDDDEEEEEEEPTWDKDSLWPQDRMARVSITCSVFITLSQYALGSSAKWFPALHIPSAVYWPVSCVRYVLGMVPQDSLVRSHPLPVGVAVTTLAVSSTSMLYRSGLLGPLERLLVRYKNGIKSLCTAGVAVAGVSLLQHGKEALTEPGIMQGVMGWGLWTLGCTGIFSFVVQIAHASRLTWARNPRQKLYWMFATQACLTASVIAFSRIRISENASVFQRLMADVFAFETSQAPKAAVGAAGLVLGFDALGKVWEQEVLKDLVWVPFRVCKKLYKLAIAAYNATQLGICGSLLAWAGHLVLLGAMAPELAPSSSIFRRLLCAAAGFAMTSFSSIGTEHPSGLNWETPPYVPAWYASEFYRLAMTYICSLLPFSPSPLHRGTMALFFLGHGAEMLIVQAARLCAVRRMRVPAYAQPLTALVNRTQRFIVAFMREVLGAFVSFVGIEILLLQWMGYTLVVGGLFRQGEAVVEPASEEKQNFFLFLLSLPFLGLSRLQQFFTNVLFLLLFSTPGRVPGTLFGVSLVLGGLEIIGRCQGIIYMDECLTTPARTLRASLKQAAIATRDASVWLWRASAGVRTSTAENARKLWGHIERAARWIGNAVAAVYRRLETIVVWVYGMLETLVISAWKAVCSVAGWVWKAVCRGAALTRDLVIRTYNVLLWAAKKTIAFVIKRWKILSGVALLLVGGALFTVNDNNSAPQIIAFYTLLCSVALELMGREFDLPVLRSLLSAPLRAAATITNRILIAPACRAARRSAASVAELLTRISDLIARYVTRIALAAARFLRRWWKLIPASLCFVAAAAFFVAFLTKVVQLGPSSHVTSVRDGMAPLLASISLLTVGADVLGSMGSPRAQQMARKIARNLDLGAIEFVCNSLIPNAYYGSLFACAWLAARLSQQLPFVKMVSAMLHGFVTGLWRNTVGAAWRALKWSVWYIWQRPVVSFALSLSSLYLLYRVHSGTLQVPFQGAIPAWLSVHTLKALPAAAWGVWKGALNFAATAVHLAYSALSGGAVLASDLVARGAAAAGGQVGALKDIVENSEVPLSAVAGSPRVGFLVWVAVLSLGKQQRSENNGDVGGLVIICSLCAHFFRHILVYCAIGAMVYVCVVIAAGLQLRRDVERSVRQVRHDRQQAQRAQREGEARDAGGDGAQAQEGGGGRREEGAAPAQLFNTECPICFAEFQHEEGLSAFPCGHCFHPACLDGWLDRGRRDCPTCRQVPAGTGAAARVARVLY